MARTSPLCSACGKEHWNFTPCGEQKRAPDVLRRGREDGLVEWGDRLDTLTRHGNTFWLKNPTVSSGTLTGPEGWTPPEAA